MYELNRKEIPVGTIVYYIQKNDPRWSVWFATVKEHYPSCIALQLYELKDRRIIDGVPVKDLVTPTRFKKIPKGYDYKTPLYTVEYSPLPFSPATGRIDHKDDIEKAIELGVFVKVQDNDHCQIDVEVTKEGWRLIRKYPMWTHHISHISVLPHHVYLTYEDAMKEVNAHRAELERQANLTEEEFSIEEIDRTINRWAGMYGASDTDIEKTRNFILSQKHLEDIETRIFGRCIQWKYIKNKTWLNIEV